jgi:hypothetical protein
MQSNIEVIEQYYSLGYKIIPIYKNSKIPIFNNWQNNYNFEFIIKFLKSFAEPINFGLLLGEVIDIEGDCKESNEIIDSILSSVKHPVFISNKSKHHIFKSNIKNLTRVVKDGIEYRGYRHQSIIPPSMHQMGQKYEWIKPLVAFNDLPEIPFFVSSKIQSLLLKKQNKIKKNNNNKNICKPNHSKALCQACNNTFFIDNNRLKKDIEYFKTKNKKWMCQECRKLKIPIVM